MIRYWIKVHGNRGLGNGVDAEGKDVRVFVDTEANVNTMSRSQRIAFLDANVGFDYVEGPFGGLEVQLVGGQTLHVIGDKDRISDRGRHHHGQSPRCRRVSSLGQ